MSISFNNSFTTLPAGCFRSVQPELAPQPAMIRNNPKLAKRLNIDASWLGSAEALAVFSGNRIPEGAEPIAAAYAGHQFGNWNPQLGDGRAILLGEVLTEDQERFDIQLKGSGRTPWSRGGDGKSPLGPVLREYILSEAMAALSVPTTRALAAVSTGDLVYRDTGALPGAVLTRVAHSHIRIGTIQFFAARREIDIVRALVEMTLTRLFPERTNSGIPALALLESVINVQAELIAKWQCLGFIHGVMNTDNMLLSGETIDYGPCAFMDTFKAGMVYSSIDHQGRYAYGNQPSIAHWNLAQLAQALLPLIDENEEAATEKAQEAINEFPVKFLENYYKGFAEKLGLKEENRELTDALLKHMEEHALDFSLTFRKLAVEETQGFDEEKAAIGPLSPSLKAWRQELLASGGGKDTELMLSKNALYIPRNHQVERAIATATNTGDYSVFHQLCDLLETPYTYQPGSDEFIQPPKSHEEVRQTFCGT